SARTLNLSDGSTKLTEFSAVSNSATPSLQSYEYTGGSGSLYLFSAGSGINVYLIKIVYGSSSSASVTAVTISGSSSVAVGSSVTLTATPNATPSGAYTWKITEGSNYVTLGTSTTNTVTVTGKAAGTAKITASVDDVTSEPHTVTVREPGTNVISLTDTPTGYAGHGYTTSPYYTGKNTITIDASSATAAEDLKTYAKKGNYVIYIKGMIDMTYNTKYGGSMLPTSWKDDNAALGKFIAAQYNANTMTDNVSKIESWSAWRQAYGAFCTQTGDNSDYSSTAAEKASTIDRYQYELVKAWKAQIQIPLASNTTIIGLDNNSGIKGGNISISGANNIMLRNLHLQDAFDPFPHHEKASSGKTDGWNAEYDCVTIQGKNSYIWIDHCTFEDTISVGWTNFAGVKTGYNVPAQAYSTSNSDYEMWQTYDGLCDIKGKTTNVTVSYCVFKNHDKTMLLGSDDNEKYDNVVLDHTAKTITLHHNYFNGCVQRLPFVRTAHIHIYNNYFSHAGTNGYDQKASIQIRAKAWVISEKNNFGLGISYRYKGDKATSDKNYVSDTKLYDAEDNVGVSKEEYKYWTVVTPKPFDPGYTPEYDNANDLPTLLPDNAGAGVWTVQQ
ncbi:MAG: polysaccharide lyase family 1 protein, partial [Treponemataceae bacterium]|nr:polysaccharide lyase family 1 protein [Treponemataceae bacterium]